MFSSSSQLPTDNLYKFMAITGLLAVILSVWGIVVINTQANREYIEQKLEVAKLRGIQNPSSFEKEKCSLLDREAEVKKGDKSMLIFGLAILLIGGLGSMIFGFAMWYLKIQPIADATAKMQLEYLTFQAEKLKRELSPPQ